MSKKQKNLAVLASVFLMLLTIAPVSNAMHIMEGFLPVKYCILWGVICVHVHFLNLFYIYWSKASLLKAGGLVFKALGAVSALYMMTLTTPLSEIIAVLRKAHIPKLIIELMNMIYRYIFIMIDTHSRMKNSAESRLGYCDFKTSCYSFGQVASNLLVVSLKRGNNYYNALEARCYDGDLRFLEEEKPLKAGQIAMAVIFIVVLMLIWFFTR